MDAAEHSIPSIQTIQLAPWKEIFSWAMFDFANSSYSTVISTTIFNAYFVDVIASHFSKGTATLLWTTTVAIANALVVVSAPLIGSIADHSALKKRFLILATLGCIIFTVLLSLVGPEYVHVAMILTIIASVLYASGENLIAAFLPEICPKALMGRISALGWSLGYLGGLLTLAVCLGYVHWAQIQGLQSTAYVPVILRGVASIFLVAALPTFLFLKERAHATNDLQSSLFKAGFIRLKETLLQSSKFVDLFRFLITLFTYSCGSSTVIVMASVYAQQAMGFTTQDIIALMLTVNISASIGALCFGFLQDKLGSVSALRLALLVWIVAVGLIFFTHEPIWFWFASNLMGIALGGSQSGGRALVGLFAPIDRSAEFFGLWGLAVKLSAIVGPMTFGLLTYLTNGNYRDAILSVVFFFIIGLALLFTVDEQSGIAASRGGV